MNVGEEKAYTAEILRVDISEVDYITEEYLKDMESAEEETEENIEFVPEGDALRSRVGYYCNSVRITVIALKVTAVNHKLRNRALS